MPTDIYRLITKVRLTMLFLSGFELYSGGIPMKLELFSKGYPSEL